MTGMKLFDNNYLDLETRGYFTERGVKDLIICVVFVKLNEKSYSEYNYYVERYLFKKSTANFWLQGFPVEGRKSCKVDFYF